MRRFTELQLLLQNEPLVLSDGAMGTQLDKEGLPMSGTVNLTHPQKVVAIHRAYASAGCRWITTNTLTMNRVAIESQQLSVDPSEVNRVGARLAREAAMEGQFVLGNISSTGQLLEPLGSLTRDIAFESYREQAEALNDGGVDGFIIETVFDLREAICALQACKSVSSKPIMVTIAFATTARGGRTVMGNSAVEAARALTDEGAMAVGANCGDLTPEEMAEIIHAMRSQVSVPLIAQPNAGRPKLVEGKACFDLSAEDFARGLKKCVEAGASIIGGCCGTTPEHIEAVRKDYLRDT